MKIAGKHIGVLGLGVSAIGVIVMILYYRHMQAQADVSTQSDGSSALGAFPYFQTAALPGGGSGTSSGGSTVSATPAATVDYASILKEALDAQTSSDTLSLNLAQMNTVANENNNWTDIATSTLARIATASTGLIQGSFRNTPSGYDFTLQATPNGGAPWGGVWGSGPGNLAFVQTPQTPQANVLTLPTNSTNSNPGGNNLVTGGTVNLGNTLATPLAA